MDNDTLRRGRPTLHVVYGDGIAILAGDGLQAEAFTLLAREPARRRSATIVGAQAAASAAIVGDAAGAVGMVGGQAIDLQAAGQAPGHAITLDADGLRAHARAQDRRAHPRRRRSAGAIMAGADADGRRAIDRYATEVGLAFQIVDDILDVEGSAAELGKTAGKDAADGKPTYPALFGLERSRALAAECIGARARRARRRARTRASRRRISRGRSRDWVVTRTEELRRLGEEQRLDIAARRTRPRRRRASARAR